MNIVLIGYRGAGKSSVGTLLSERLGWPLISTDAEIVKRLKLSIPQIVEQLGWDNFRAVESEVCRDVAQRDRVIIDTGGGAILRPENVESLRAHGLLFWLTAEIPTIIQRIGGDTGRPSLTGTKSFTEEIEEVLRERRPKYQAAAHHVIRTDGRTVVQVAEEVLGKAGAGS
jgi:shikimate kinase